MENGNVVKMEDVELQRIFYKGQPILSYDDIDKVHGRPEGTAKRNFKEHRENFVIEKDYFDLPYEEWSILVVRNAYDQNSQGGHRGNRVFFTMYGYLKLSKVFTDAKAWKVHDVLVDSYFGLKAIQKPVITKDIGRIEDKLVELPGRPLCIIDRDLSEVYGVETGHLNWTRKINPKRFTEGVNCFQLTHDELKSLGLNENGGHLSWAYSQKGAHMFAFIFRTEEAFAQAIMVIEGFNIYNELMKNTMPSGDRRCKALCFKGRHLHLLNFGKYGEVAIVKEVAAALGLHKGGLRDKARAYPEVGGSIAVLKGEAFTLFKAACKPAGIRLKSKSIAICPIERLSNLLLYGRTDKAELELYRLVNGYLMGTQPAVELTPYRRTAQGQLLNNN